MRRVWFAAVLLLVPTTAALAQGIGGMGGSTNSQWLYATYSQQMTAVALGQVNNVLAVVAPVMFVVAQIVAWMLAKRALYGNLSVDTAVTYIIRFGLVSLLMVPANFNRFIVQTATQTLPQQIAATVNGNPQQTVAQAFDGEQNEIINLASRLRAQAAGPYYVGERIAIWFYSGLASGFVYLTQCIFGIVSAVLPWLLPLGALLAPFAIFEATNQFFMRWLGKMVSLYLVMFLSIQLGAFVAKANAMDLQQYAHLVAAQAAQPQFKMNAGDTLFKSLGITPAQADVGAFDVPGADPASVIAATANVSVGIQTLINVCWAMAYGFFVLTLVTGIAMFIGGAHGFSLAPLVNAGTSIARLALTRGRR